MAAEARFKDRGISLLGMEASGGDEPAPAYLTPSHYCQMTVISLVACLLCTEATAEERYAPRATKTLQFALQPRDNYRSSLTKDFSFASPPGSCFRCA
ncbi:unnamed protein product [Arctia plantaginis]|uniref:Uncharacterized protein n=1 Tax=Arctia plantaginis TaxID=874455 RepID=A0A8S0YT65_ARCPL|nr:unnamed protein product [Arctia plantaginis]